MRRGVLCCCLLLSPVAIAGEAPRTLYRNAVLIDGTGAPARPGTSILVEGERIAAVMPDAQARTAGATVVDLRGRYVVPGLIDTHVHLATPPDAAEAKKNLRRQLYSGVTAVRSMADDVRSVGELSRQALVGEIPSPDIHYAALMAGPGFFKDPRTIAVTRGRTPGQTPWMQAIDERTDLVLAVAMARGTSADGIKLYADMPGPLLAKITTEAHRQGIPVWAHAAVFPAMPADDVAAGVDVISHSCPLAYEASPHKPASYHERTPVDESAFKDGAMPASITGLFASMAARGTILDATNLVYVRHVAEYARDKQGAPPRCSAGLTLRLTAQAFQQGVAISSGTDGDNPDEAPFPSLHDELDLLAGPVGMPPMEVLRAATATAARALGQEKAMGTIEPGKLANLVVLSEDPLTDIDHLRSVTETVKRGVRYPRSAFHAVTEKKAGASGRD
ncbi:amidohydrolase family protein [Pseudoxanthomonas daejeonensis]|uniref:amidohydrolase family protein n=1 Tax=Pseudoxanthomonas daejeonensis TaxID=266062 RepID=UPI001F540987|nr:amidohydrolase family protein [Pseudoxanthomonas daejeonensis]UNK56639.1 amidohydrolase family protein [Pseudoxanthomonas daejeonensis]